jgi:hypothetical protein
VVVENDADENEFHHGHFINFHSPRRFSERRRFFGGPPPPASRSTPGTARGGARAAAARGTPPRRAARRRAGVAPPLAPVQAPARVGVDPQGHLQHHHRQQRQHGAITAGADFWPFPA